MQQPDPAQRGGQAWVLSDGHAGNVRQAAALVRALGVADVRDIVLEARAPWRWLAPRRLPGAQHAFGQDFSVALRHPPRIAVGCGRQAALATRLLHEHGTQAVQILDPRIDSRHWDLVIAPEHDGLQGNNVITLLGSLHPIDDAWLAQARADVPVLAQLPQPRTTLLLGGPGGHVGMDDASLAAHLAQLASVLRREGGSVLVTTSRRTPDAWYALVRKHFAMLPGLRWFGTPPAEILPAGIQVDGNPYPGLLAWADRIVCTPDSVNMVSEACATRAPVFVLDPQQVGGRVRHFLDALLARGRIRAVDAVLASFAVDPLRETARIAAEVRTRLGFGSQPEMT